LKSAFAAAALKESSMAVICFSSLVALGLLLVQAAKNKVIQAIIITGLLRVDVMRWFLY
jgi:hypothetical protein